MEYRDCNFHSYFHSYFLESWYHVVDGAYDRRTFKTEYKLMWEENLALLDSPT